MGVSPRIAFALFPDLDKGWQTIPGAGHFSTWACADASRRSESQRGDHTPLTAIASTLYYLVCCVQ